MLKISVFETKHHFHFTHLKMLNAFDAVVTEIQADYFRQQSLGKRNTPSKIGKTIFSNLRNLYS